MAAAIGNEYHTLLRTPRENNPVTFLYSLCLFLAAWYGWRGHVVKDSRISGLIRRVKSLCARVCALLDLVLPSRNE